MEPNIEDDPSMEEEDDQVVVVTKRCDTKRYNPDADTVLCSICGNMTWISSSFRDKKIDKVVCEICFEKDPDLRDEYNKDDCYICITEDCLEEAISIVKNEIENLKGKSREEVKEEMLAVVEKKTGKKIKVVNNIAGEAEL